MPEKIPPNDIPLFISRSFMTTEDNMTGSWRYARPIYDPKTAPCSEVCPAGQDIGRILMLANNGSLKQAWEAMMMENPFPSVCGRVCYFPCEHSCNRTGLDEAVAIHLLERYIGDTAIREGYRPIKNNRVKNGKKVAVFGAGPAGLSTAYFLTRLGFACDVFEAKTKPGGLLRWGIPEYRLPIDILEKEIRRIEDLGVTIRCESFIDKQDFNAAVTQYDAVFFGFGHGRSISMNIPGENMACDGLEFLSDISKGDAVSVDGTAAVIGGGNTAVDVARSLVRMGVETILLYRRRIQDMPAFNQEVASAVKEGVKIKELITPVRIEKNNQGCLLTLQRMKTGGVGPSGRLRVLPEGEKTETFQVQKVYRAIGAQAGEQWHLPQGETENIISLSHCAILQKDKPLLFGGDLTNQDLSVTHAIASGKQAAMALDIFFQTGWDTIKKELAGCKVGCGSSLSMEIYLKGDRKSRSRQIVPFSEINVDYFPSHHRVEAPHLSPGKRVESFVEIENTLSPISAEEEMARCFNCGICNICGNCRLYCPEMAVILEDEQKIDLDYCKGCGVCVVECPRNAMTLVEENV